MGTFFSKRTNNLRKRLKKECVTSTTRRRALKSGFCAFSFFSSPRGRICAIYPRCSTVSERPVYPASGRMFCGYSSVGSGRNVTIPSRVSSGSLTSCRLAPSGTTDKGRPCSSVNTLLFVPVFPRSAGLRPAASLANGAFTIQPSTLCHSRPIPSGSSYFSSPSAQIFSKKPASSHS